MTEQLDGQESIFDLDIWSGRMSPEPFHQTEARTSKPSSPRSSELRSQRLPMFLYLKDGQWQDASPGTGGAWHGEYMMRSFGEKPSILTEESSFPALPNGVEESRLSQILTDRPHPKYYLSAKAAAGILRRAAKRGKELPEVLKNALMRQSTQDGERSVFKSEQDAPGGEGSTDSR